MEVVVAVVFLLLVCFHDDFKKVRVFRFPFADARFLQMPSVDDVTVQNQSSAVYSTKKITDLVFF